MCESIELFGSSYEIEVIITENIDKFKKVDYEFHTSICPPGAARKCPNPSIPQFFRL